MRWRRDPLLGMEDQTRTIKKFLWFPKRIGNNWRWLEKVRILQKVEQVDVGGSMEWGNYKHFWIDQEWIK